MSVLHLTEDQASELWGNFFRADSLIRLLYKFHEDNPHELDTHNTLAVVLDHMADIRDILDHTPTEEEKREAAAA